MVHRLSRASSWLVPVLWLGLLAGCDSTAEFATLTPADAQRPVLVIDWTPDTTWLARATVTCAITANGRPTLCRLTHLVGNPAFGPVALGFVRSVIFETGFASGQGKPIKSYDFKVGFIPIDKFAPPLQKAEIAYAPDPTYPPRIADAGKGKVDLTCDIDPGGNPRHCQVSHITGNPAFGPPALRAASRAHYLPAWQHGAPVTEHARHITLYFTPPVQFPGLPGPAQNPSPAQGYALIDTTPVFYRGGPHYPSEAAYHKQEGAVLTACTIATDGTLHHCRALARTGPASFAFYALAYVRHQTFRLTRQGKPASAPYYEIVQFTLDKNNW